ncbi:MAG: hypothetical protein QM598_01310 [Protaetiibacter sp.]
MALFVFAVVSICELECNCCFVDALGARLAGSHGHHVVFHVGQRALKERVEDGPPSGRTTFTFGEDDIDRARGLAVDRLQDALIEILVAQPQATIRALLATDPEGRALGWGMPDVRFPDPPSRAPGEALNVDTFARLVAWGLPASVEANPSIDVPPPLSLETQCRIAWSTA